VLGIAIAPQARRVEDDNAVVSPIVLTNPFCEFEPTHTKEVLETSKEI
jgi:hypothetical protein